MNEQMEDLKKKWQNKSNFLPFIEYCNESLDSVDLQLTLQTMPVKFLNIAHTILIKHFDQAF